MTDRDMASERTRRQALQNAIAGYTVQGYRVVSQTDTTAQLVKPKSLSCLLAVVLFILGVVPLILYLIYYMASKDSQVYLTVDEFGTVNVPQVSGGIHISRGVGGILLVGIGVLAFLIALAGFAGGSNDLATGIGCFLVPGLVCLGLGSWMLFGKKPEAKAS